MIGEVFAEEGKGKTVADLRVTTPSAITGQVVDFCRSIVPDVKPVSVKVIPHKLAIQNGCFGNVRLISKSVRSTGEQGGWIIWEGCVHYEAVPHAVWVVRNRYVDVTPHPGGEKRVLFLADPSVTFDSGPSLAKHYCPRIDHPTVHRLLEVMRKDEELQRRYRDSRGLLHLPRPERRALVREIERLSKRIDGLLTEMGR